MALCLCGSLAPSPLLSTLFDGHSNALRDIACREDPMMAAHDSAEFERALSLTGSLASSLHSFGGSEIIFVPYLVDNLNSQIQLVKFNFQI